MPQLSGPRQRVALKLSGAGSVAMLGFGVKDNEMDMGGNCTEGDDVLESFSAPWSRPLDKSVSTLTVSSLGVPI